MESYPAQESLMLPEKVAAFVARLEIGKEVEDRIKSPLETDEQLAHFGEQLAQFKRLITHPKTADCMDDRPTISLADGTTDPEVLRQRITYQLPGGLGLAVTKAAIAANTGFLRDAKDFKSAYLLTSKLLQDLGYEDGGHAGCGASKFLELSIAEPVNEAILAPTVGAITRLDGTNRHLFEKIQQTKRQRLGEGFYGGWVPSFHEDYLSQKVPHNFSHLRVTDSPTHGHDALGVDFIQEKAMGFAKNDFYDSTGQMAFGVTLTSNQFMIDLINKLSSTDEERAALSLAFADDVVNVSDKLLAPGMPAFADVA